MAAYRYAVSGSRGIIAVLRAALVHGGLIADLPARSAASLAGSRASDSAAASLPLDRRAPAPLPDPTRGRVPRSYNRQLRKMLTDDCMLTGTKAQPFKFNCKVPDYTFEGVDYWDAGKRELHPDKIAPCSDRVNSY